jgi:hypothetical protein
MRTLGIIALGVVLLIGVGVVWWHVNYPTYSYRYRLTLAIETGGKVHTGSSVIEIIWSGGPEIGDVGPYHPRIRGQAALVDLGSSGAILAALINGESYGPAADGALGALWIVPRAFGTNSALEHLPSLPHLTGQRKLTPDNMLRLIWFADISDPKTARKILPGEIPQLLGPHSRLVDSYIEITRDPLVIDIDKKIPWFKPWADRYRQEGPIRLPNGTVLSRYMFLGDAS